MKKSALILLTLALLFVFSACIGPGLSDWHYDLPNGYQIVHVNSRQIICTEKDSPGAATSSIIVEAHVSEFCYNDRYIGLKRVDPPDDVQEAIDLSNPVYYIVDMITKEIYGELSESEYTSKIEELNIENMCDWLLTNPAPEGAIYPEI